MSIHLKAARVNAGYTQEEVVEALRKQGCKISKNTIINYEAYRTTPDIEIAVKMAELYGMSVDNIIFFAK